MSGALSIFLTLLAVPVLLIASPRSLTAQDLTILVGRMDNATELYLMARADIIFEVFDTSPKILTGSHDKVNLSALSNGTFEAADVLMSNAEVQIGDYDAGFEAMSLMVHPLDQPLPMTTPLEALTAIGVCSALPAERLVIPLQELRAYVGYFTSEVALRPTMSLNLPYEAQSPLRVSLLDFYNGRLVATRHFDWVGSPLVIEPPRTPEKSSLALMLIGLLTGATSLFGLLSQSRTDPALALGA